MVYSWHILPGGIAMELTDSLKSLCIETAKALKGSARRLFMARTVAELGAGGPRRAERALGWGRMTIRKGTHELESGFTCLDAFAARGRKRVEVHLPNLLSDIQTIVDTELLQSKLHSRFYGETLAVHLSNNTSKIKQLTIFGVDLWSALHLVYDRLCKTSVIRKHLTGLTGLPAI